MAPLMHKFLFCIAASITMFAGSQWVHNIYRPLDDFENIVQQEVEKKRKELQKELAQVK